MGALLSEPVTAMVVERRTSALWTASTATMQGWRKTHEDAHILSACGASEGAGVFAVLDGHGGHIAAHLSAAMLEDRLVKLACQGTMDAASAVQELQAAFLDADAKLRDELPAEDRSGTTVVAAIVTETQPSKYCVQLAHCGDSRAVLCAGQDLVCSQDHKPQREDETRRIRAAGGTVEHGPLGGGPLRVDGALAVSRAMGDFHFKPHDMTPSDCKVTALPEVTTVSGCSAGDWLLLACDGVFDVMENEDVRQFVSTRLREQGPGPADGGQIVVDLLKLCVDKGSKDNCTACLVQFHPGGEARYSKELLQGPWAEASPDVQARYMDFFASHGFEEEAKSAEAVIQSGQPPVHAQAKRGSVNVGGHHAASVETSGPEDEGPSSTTAAAGQRQLAALAKALQAMRSSRTIQGAWRARRSGGGAGSSGGAGGATSDK